MDIDLAVFFKQLDVSCYKFCFLFVHCVGQYCLLLGCIFVGLYLLLKSLSIDEACKAPMILSFAFLLAFFLVPLLNSTVFSISPADLERHLTLYNLIRRIILQVPKKRLWKIAQYNMIDLFPACQMQIDLLKCDECYFLQLPFRLAYPRFWLQLFLWEFVIGAKITTYFALSRSVHRFFFNRVFLYRDLPVQLQQWKFLPGLWIFEWRRGWNLVYYSSQE